MTLIGRRLRTVGVEEELMLVDAETMQPVPVAGTVLGGIANAGGLPGGLPGGHRPILEFEVKHEQIEVVSPPFHTVDEIYQALLAGRQQADDAARAAGSRAVALATAVLPCEPHLVSVPRYERMRERFGLTLDEQLTCGFHVHVSIGSDEEGVAVLDRIRPWLPVLLALSTNSPFWQGVDTGFASYRYQTWNRWPTAGAYDVSGSADAYFERLAENLAADVSLDAGMIYSDARLSHHVPTVEVRIADVCLRAADAAALAVLTRALVEKCVSDWEVGRPPDPVPTSFLRLASWRASKSGINDTLIHPSTRKPVFAGTAVHALLLHVRDHFADDAEKYFVLDAVADILRQGTGERRQRAAMATRADCVDVVAEALRWTAGA